MRFFTWHILAGVITVSMITWSGTLHSAERRCGWFESSGPDNAILTDRDGAWEVASQGSYQAQGEWPEFNSSQWVRSGRGNYGYGCACVTADTDRQARRINNLTKATARPLSACRTDKTLREPENRLAEERQSIRYQDNDFSVSYPKGWTVKKHNQCVHVNRPGRPANEEYTLSICVQHGVLEEATDSMIFYNDKGIWMRHAGMDAPSPVDIIEGADWKGMQATQTCGVSDEETGFHAAGGICLMAIVYNDNTQLLFDTVGFYQGFDVINSIIQSVKFNQHP